VLIDPEASEASDPSDVVARRLIALSMTLTNLDGIPYSIQYPGTAPDKYPPPFYALAYRDYAPFLICGKQVRHLSIPIEDIKRPGAVAWQKCPTATWDEAKEAAIISGSFPIAFHSRPLERDLTLYCAYQEFKNTLGRNIGTLPDRATFQFTDGGIFSNQPIDRAIDAVCHLNVMDPDRAHDHRNFLVIEPDPNTARSVSNVLCPPPGAEDPNGLSPGTLMARLVGAYFNDALFSDFQQVAKVNDHLRTLSAAVDRLEAACDWSKRTRDNWEGILRDAVGLGHKQELHLERIPCNLPVTDPLAGDFAAHFGGFLDESLRAADFETGRHEATPVDAWVDSGPEREPRFVGIGSRSSTGYICAMECELDDHHA
jgi:hypothetical protein